MEIRENKISTVIKVLMNMSALIFLVFTIIMVVCYYTEKKNVDETANHISLLDEVISRYCDLYQIMLAYMTIVNILDGNESDISSVFSGSRKKMYLEKFNYNVASMKIAQINISSNNEYSLIKNEAERMPVTVYEFAYANEEFYNYTRPIQLDILLQNVVNRMAEVYHIFTIKNVTIDLNDTDWLNIVTQYQYIEVNFFNSIKDALEYADDYAFNTVNSVFRNDEKVKS